MLQSGHAAAHPVESGAVVTKAVLKASDLLDVSNKVLSRILGLSEASVSRMRRGAYTLSPSDKSFELAVLFVRLFRSLDSIVGGDTQTMRAWVRNDNVPLGGTPLARVQTIAGLVDVIAYLDARRAVI